MKPTKPRVPEADPTGGAITDVPELDMEAYSRFCERYLAGEYRKLVDRMVEALGANPTGQVLEIGPGPGWIGIGLARRLPGIKVVGLELSPDMLRVAKANRARAGLENLQFVAGNAADMPFPDASFDGVISNGSLHHWLEPTRVFDEAARVMKPGGILLISDGRRDLTLRAEIVQRCLSTIVMLDPSVPGRVMRRGWRSSINAGYTPEELKTLLASSKLARARVEEGFFDLTVSSMAFPTH